jgi:hypothetical protein
MSAFTNSLSGWFGRKKLEDESSTSGSTTTGGTREQEPVVVWQAANLMEAQIVVGRLQSEDIPAIMRGEAVGSIYGFTSGGLAETDVLVPAPLADRATEILNTEIEWDESEIEMSTDEAVDPTDQVEPDQ